MGWGASMLRALLLLLDFGGAPVLATGKSAGTEIDIKYAIIGTALGVAISAVFLVLKICTIKKHLFEIDASDLRSTNPGFHDSVTLKKTVPRKNVLNNSQMPPNLSNLNFSERDEQVIEL